MISAQTLQFFKTVCARGVAEHIRRERCEDGARHRQNAQLFSPKWLLRRTTTSSGVCSPGCHPPLRQRRRRRRPNRSCRMRSPRSALARLPRRCP